MIWLLFALIQIVNLPLMILGIPVIAFDVIENEPIPWIWENEDDPPAANWTRWHTFKWLALRNPVANLRHIPGVSGTGRPLFYRTWTDFGKQFYVKVGWMSNGYPALSAGAGRGY
jgi:hypothetical protein